MDEQVHVQIWACEDIGVKHAVQPHILGMHRSLMGLLSFKVWEINWIWSEGVRKVPWWSRTSHVSTFNICENLIFMIRDIYFIMQFMQNIFVCVCVYTDWFKSNGREKSINHKVNFLRQMRLPEVFQQSFFASQTIDQHAESQPTHRPAQTLCTALKTPENAHNYVATSLTVTVTSIC